EMRGEIRRVCKESGLTAIYVTHDQKEALSVADRMAILDAGEIRQIGSPREVYRQPNSRFVADFMGETNFLEGKVTALWSQGVAVETALGSFQALVGLNSRHQPGDSCLVSIRPESWNLAAEPTPLNCVVGRIRDRVYLGEMAQYEFLAASGLRELKIYELNPRFVDLSEEREVYASVDPQDVVVLPDL
ncbi:MAG: spermidine/putrescine transporter ATP-binding protein, partial [Chthoniobacteraceae bacterium]|nr:spermidine/putrescine transporter ATP-binding protein [Chthoniobacteraceae bacterium]